MISSYVIAESGGTKTDWLLVIDDEVRGRRTTGSLHPSAIDESSQGRFIAEWTEFSQWTNYPLFLFGAGCFRENGQRVVSELISSVFYPSKVFSDLHAAAIALYGKNSGWFAIMGTGSVLGYWNGLTVTEIIGGLGYQFGDEGSGFYFGRLLLEAAQEGKLNNEQLVHLSKVYPKPFPDFSDVKSIDRSEVAAIPGELIGDGLFNPFHISNFRGFFEKYIRNENSILELGIVGSYGYHQQNNLIKVAEEFNVKITRVIERPIDKLFEQKGCFVE